MTTPKIHSQGFSLIEVMLSLALVASAIVTIMALIPVGLKSSREAANSMVLGHIFEDAHERLEGHPLVDGELEEPFFYDDEGIYVDSTDTEEGNSTKKGSKIEIVDETERKPVTDAETLTSRELRRVYSVNVKIVTPQNIAHAPGLKAVILRVAWPVDPITGDPPAVLHRGNSKSITYYVNTLTGPGWSDAQSGFEPVIEF